MLLVIMTTIIFTAGCGGQKPDPSPDKQKDLTSAEEQEDTLSLSAENSQDSVNMAEEQLSKQENDQLIDETLKTLNELETVINSLDEVSDSDLQIPEGE